MTNRDLLDCWFAELWVKRNPAIIDEMVDPECTIHGLPGVKHGPAGFRPFHELFTRAFSRVEIHVDDALEAGDRIGFRCTVTVLTRGGRPFDFTGGGICRFREGRIVEAWNMFDNLSLLTSLGYVAPTCFLDALQDVVRRAES